MHASVPMRFGAGRLEMGNKKMGNKNHSRLVLQRVGRLFATLAVVTAVGCSSDDSGVTSESSTSDTTTDSTSNTDTSTTSETTTETSTTGTTSVGSDSNSTTGTDSDTSTTTTTTTTGTTGSSCGDGVVDDGEICDDGVNDGAYDGCASDCTAYGPSCGDGEVNGSEGCDDGNDIDDDECSNSCTAPGCGDGVVNGEEICDDANDDNADGCLNTCVAASCGDGFVWDGMEACDDANDDNTDGCLDTCEMASCGDSYIYEGVELCDDGINDGSYDGCGVDCAELGPSCGDGIVNGEEACDDNNENITDGCLGDCSAAATCLVIKNYDDAAEDGMYTVAPEGVEPFDVYCDMTTDGGGYTFLKIDPKGNYFAKDAELECDKYGMDLFIPRTKEHKTRAWAISNDANIGPDASANYLRILGIYPKQNGAKCTKMPMNFGNKSCGWKASDDGPWYVHEVTNISEPNGDNNVIGSMYYGWKQNGDISWHNDISGNGYSSNRFMCDFGDKQ